MITGLPPGSTIGGTNVSSPLELQVAAAKAALAAQQLKGFSTGPPAFLGGFSAVPLARLQPMPGHLFVCCELFFEYSKYIRINIWVMF